MQSTSYRRSRGGSSRDSRSNSSRSPKRRFSSRGSSRRKGPKQAIFDPSRFINTNPVEAKEEAFVPKNQFDTLGLEDKLVKSVLSQGIKTPTPIQDQIIPEILKGHDVIGLAETGTGKTAAFLIPLIQKTLTNPGQRTLILTPTRELAIQIEEELRKITRGFRIFSVTCVGGVNIHPQLRALKRTNHFIIGTPGRVLDLINRKSIRTHEITNVVLDEADRMLDMGFINDMRSILSATPADRHTLFFSATMSPSAKQLVHDFLKNPIEISVKKREVTNTIAQDVVRYEHHNKFSTLCDLLSDPESKRVIVFGAMKHSVEKLAQQLSAEGLTAESIHGNKNHGQRQRSLKRFKDGNVKILVATDVAARGINVENVSHVINYDLPNSFEDYVHRIGRTGRAAKKGIALTFVPTHN